MSDLKKEKEEALVVAGEYCVKLQKGIITLLDELRTGRLFDTGVYMETILKGINWIFEVYNATKDMFDENTFDKDLVNKGVIELNDAINAGNDNAIADALENGILPFIKQFSEVTKSI